MLETHKLNIMSSSAAIKMLLCLLTAIVLFHISIIVKLMPFEFIWGGELTNDCEMYTFECISVVVYLMLIPLLLIKGKYIKEIIPQQFINVILWSFFTAFGLSTLGNILSETRFERYFSILTLACSYLIWVILKREVRVES